MTFRELVEHSHLQASIGVLLLIISIFEIAGEPFIVSLEHSVFLLGFYHLILGLPNIFQALEKIVRFEKKK